MPLSRGLQKAFQVRYGFHIRDAKKFERPIDSRYRDTSLNIIGRGNVTLDTPQRSISEIDEENLVLSKKVAGKF